MIGGRYSLDREIGRGGMGAVWVGTDETLGRTVALKRVGVAPGGADTDVRRAEREARLAARLNHPHVVAVFDLVDEGDAQWMVMEYVEGTNLSQIIRDNGPMPPDQVAPILSQVADALAAAHSAGIVHRDVKPSNILVSPDGNVKLTDFGIARTEADAALTQTGLVTGSPAYLAPEVARGQSATEASDVWSLGATICHALAGKPPYDVGSNVMGTLYRIVNDPPPRPAGAGWLDPLLAASMEKEPERRWPAARVRDFLEAGPTTTRTATMPTVAPTSVQAPVQSTKVMAPPPPPPPAVRPTSPRRRPDRTPLLLLAGLAGLVVLAVLVAVLAGTGDDDPGRTASSSPSGSSTREAGQGDGSGRDDQVTAREMETFIRDYLDLVVSDPEAAFQRLTPAFQERSGGLDGYLSFWGEVTSTRVESVTADPDTMTVSYRYTRHVKGGGKPVPDDVELRLEQDDGGDLLIAGEA